MRNLFLLIICLSSISCNSQDDKNLQMISKHKYTNALINETSPYLLQHAHNPVNWYPWNEQTLQLAKKQTSCY